jgi:hypothetical protein
MMLIDNVDWETAPQEVHERDNDGYITWTGTKIRRTDGSYQVVPLDLEAVLVVFAFSTYGVA